MPEFCLWPGKRKEKRTLSEHGRNPPLANGHSKTDVVLTICININCLIKWAEQNLFLGVKGCNCSFFSVLLPLGQCRKAKKKKKKAADCLTDTLAVP